jgi:FMN phosphatase YigB (HAD superfamily)
MASRLKITDWSSHTMRKLLITDLDNTLYDWVGYFSTSFKVLVAEVSRITGIPEVILLRDYKSVHQKYNNTERPYATLELESVIAYFNTSDKNALKIHLQGAFNAFNDSRSKSLQLYGGVIETLQKLRKKGVIVVGHTESHDINAVGRIESLGLRKYLKHLYTLRSRDSSHPNPNKSIIEDNSDGWLIQLPHEERKPNPKLLADICFKEGVSVDNAFYIGDSIVKDMSMAKNAGIHAIWAEYGKDIKNADWGLLVSVTHWTDEDVKKEENLKVAFGHIKPDFTATKFSDVLAFL